MSERAFRRWRKRQEAEGPEGRYHRRLGQVWPRLAPVETVAGVLEQFETHYSGFAANHLHEKPVADHRLWPGYSWLRLTLQAHGRIKAAPAAPSRSKEVPHVDG